MQRRTINFSLYLVALITSVACNSPDNSAVHKTNFSQHVIQQLDSFTTGLPKVLPLPGVAIAVVKGDSVYYKTSGFSNVSGHIPFTDSTIFFSGNISELMVATSILKLAQSGKISLDEPVSKYLPHFRLGTPAYLDITIRHMLTHTSGIPHHDAIWDMPDTSAQALSATTRSIALQEPLFRAGTQVKRTAYNYDILADLAAHVSGKTFEDYAHDEVLIPAGMIGSAFHKDQRDQNLLALPHKVTNWLTYAIQPEEIYPYNREHAGSIGFHTSIRDMASWMRMVLNEDTRLLSQEMHAEFIKPHVQTSASYYVGMGWEIEKYDQQFIYKKTHQLGGFSADVTLVPGKRAGVFVISNIGGDFNPTVMSNQLLSYLLEQKPLGIKIPIYLAMTNKLNQTQNLDSALQVYSTLKRNNPEDYEFDVETLSQFGVNLLYRANDPEKAKRVFQFCAAEFKNSAYAHLNLVEAYLVSNDIQQATETLTIVKNLPPDHDVHARLPLVEEMLTVKKENQLDPKP